MTRQRRDRPRLVHLTTTDMSLDWLLKPQLLAFQAAGYEVIAMSAPGPFVQGLRESGIPHVPVHHATRSISPGDDVRALLELRKLFGRLEPDIVHTHNPKPGVYGRIAARAAGVPRIVNTQHGLYATPEDRFARRAAVYTLERIAASCSHIELVQNPEDLETLARLGVPRSKLVLLGNGVDLSRFMTDDVTRRADRIAARKEWDVSDQQVVVGLVGRLVVEKGYREVFAAARLLRERGVDLRFVVIGPEDHSKADAITVQEQQDAQSAGVTFLGRRDDVDRLYAGMDIYVLASHREGFPRSAMEAAASGLPLIATDIRGCREVVEHGVNGLLVPVREGRGLADAVIAIASDAGRRTRYSRASVERATRSFDQQRVIATTLSAYSSVSNSALSQAMAPSNPLWHSS